VQFFLAHPVNVTIQCSTISKNFTRKEKQQSTLNSRGTYRCHLAILRTYGLLGITNTHIDSLYNAVSLGDAKIEFYINRT